MAAPSPTRSDPAVERFAHAVTVAVGTSASFAFATAIVIAWALTGPIFHYSDTWQLIINTGTTVVTFLMVFLIQRSQNKESMATQLKLNEIVAALQGASNRLINVEELSEAEIRKLHQCFESIAKAALEEAQAGNPHSIEEARAQAEAAAEAEDR